MKRIGIVAHSAEGGSLCFVTVCREGQVLLGPHQHPEIVVSAIPMGLSMPGWESGDHQIIAHHLRRGVEQVAAAGADFFICPDNTAHIVLEAIVETLPIPGLHIADVVANQMKMSGWKDAALLGTKWTMNGSVYPNALHRHGLTARRPDESARGLINQAIFDELCRGVFQPKTTEQFINVIQDFSAAGADCVILGCTEIPLIIDNHNSPLPVLDSTRLLATYAVRYALSTNAPTRGRGWLDLNAVGAEDTPVKGR